jgi:hypothetical protein
MVGDSHTTAVIFRPLERYPEMKAQFSRPKSDWLFRPIYLIGAANQTAL